MSRRKPTPGTEVDYWNKIDDPATREWLKKFNDEERAFLRKGQPRLLSRKEREQANHANYLRKEERKTPIIPLQAKNDRGESPEDILIRTIDACSSTDLAAHLRKIASSK